MEFAQISVRVLLLNQHLRGGAEGVGVGGRGKGLRGYTQPAGNWPRLGNPRARPPSVCFLEGNLVPLLSHCYPRIQRKPHTSLYSPGSSSCQQDQRSQRAFVHFHPGCGQSVSLGECTPRILQGCWVGFECWHPSGQRKTEPSVESLSLWDQAEKDLVLILVSIAAAMPACLCWTQVRAAGCM